MKKDIKDYLHFYIGTKAMIFIDNQKTHDAEINHEILSNYFYTPVQELHKIQNIIPMLRPLSDMTEEELNFINMSRQELNHAISQNRNPSFYITEFTYLLSRGFDIFGLIEEGLAIIKLF